MSDVRGFVLNYLEESGGIAEPTGESSYDVLLPDAAAAKLGVDEIQTWSFGSDDSTQLSFASPLVERMIEDARAKPTAAKYILDSVRLNKTGLAELAQAAWLIPNARIIEQSNNRPIHILTHYLLFNFKVSLISDDKQERIVSVLMNAQGGYALSSAEAEQILLASHPQTKPHGLTHVGLRRWGTSGQSKPQPALHIDSLTELLNKATEAISDVLADPIKRLQRRSERFLALDTARLNAYYDEIERDLQLRAQRAAADRQGSLLEKLKLTAAERETKLADAAERYRVRADVRLINTLVIEQPKIVQMVLLKNRQSQRLASAVYDPFLHQIEPLICDVCEKPGQRLQLCLNGHLAHADCLAPACIDCKRVYCQHCADQVGACSVCQKPLCRPSAIKCHTCGEVTCQAHRNQCHADPEADLAVISPEKPQKSTKSQQAADEKSKRRKLKPTTRKKLKTQPRQAKKTVPPPPKGIPKPQYLAVIVSDDLIEAMILASRAREIVHRRWTISATGGIGRSCKCEKGDACMADGYMIRPSHSILADLEEEIDHLRREYRIPSKKVRYFELDHPANDPQPTQHLTLRGDWLNEQVLAQARKAYDAYMARRYR